MLQGQPVATAQGTDGEFQDLPQDVLYVPLGVSVCLQAVISPTGAAWPAGAPQWSDNADPRWMAPGEAYFSATTPFALAGEPEVVHATCGTSSADARIAALDGLTIFADRVYLGVGDSITLTAKRIVAGVLEPVDCDWTLQSGAASAAFDGATTATSSVTLTGLSVSLQYENVCVQATDSALPTEHDTAWFTVTTIRLYAAIDGGNPAEVTGNLYVPRGSMVAFEADLLPHFSPWPDGGPEWTGAEPGEAVGTASAVYVEASASVGAPELVVATCGGSAEAPVVVYDLGPIRYRFSELDPWQDAPEALAIPESCELVYVRAALLPPDIPPVDLCLGWAGAQAAAADPCEATFTPAPATLASVDAWPVVGATAGLLSRSVRAGRVSFGGIQYRVYALNPDGTPGAASEWQDSTPVPARVPVGCTVEFQAVAAASRVPLPGQCLSWSSSTGRTGNGQFFADAFPTVSASNGDLRTVLVAYSGVSPTATAAAEFVACGVGGMEWAPGASGGTWAAVARVLCVAVGEPFRLRALAAPAGPWPDGVPEWWLSGPSTVGGSASDPVVTDDSQADERTLHYTSESVPAWNPLSWARGQAGCGTSAATAHIAVVSGFTLLPSWPSVWPGGSVSVRQYEDTGMDQDADLVTVSRHWRLDQGSAKGSLSPATGQSTSFTGSTASDQIDDVHVVASDAADGPAVASASLTVVDGDVLWYATEADPLWTDSATREAPTPPAVAVARGATLDFLLGPQPDSSAQPDAMFVWPWGKPAWTVTGAECLTPGSTPQGPPTVRVVFDTPGTATVAAECGNTLTFTAGVLDIGPFTVTAAGLTTGTAEDSSPVEESREDGAVLYTGPTDDGVIAFALECELHDLFLYPPPPGVPTPSGADVGWRIQDKTGNLLTAGQFSAVEGDFATGTVSVNWAIGAADGIVQEVDFVAYYKGAGVIGGGVDGIRRLIHCTIVKPDLVLHRPKVQDGVGAAVDGWTDADSDGVRAASEEEETDPGLFMAVNDDFDSGGPAPDCEDAEVAGTAEQIAADLDDMAQVGISLPGGEVLPDDACLEITAAPQAPVRLFRVVSTDSNGDGTVDVREYEPVVGKDAAATWTIPLAEFRGSAGTSGFWLEGAEPGQTILTVGFMPPNPPPPPPTDPPDYSICQAPGGGGAATAPVGRDVARAGAIALQLDSRWLASHDPAFEAECWGSSRLRQSAVMANTITATVCTGSASVPGLECRLYEHDMWWDDPVAVGKASGPGCFVFTTDDDGDGAEETDADGAIYVNGAKLTQGPEFHPYTDYRIGVFVAGRRVREEDVTVGPLLHGLGFTPDLLASPPAKLDPYTDRVDVKIDNIPFFPWDDDEEGYGLLIRYLLATDVSGLQFTFSGIGSDSYTDTNANGHWDQGEPLLCDDGDGLYDPAGETSMPPQALQLAPEYQEARSWWHPAKIKWEGYCGLTEEAEQIAEFPDEAERPGGPGYAPGDAVKEGRYTLHIEMQHKDWPSQVQRYQIDFAVQYAY